MAYILRLLVVVGIPGCNWLFELRSTELIDAAIYDAPIDAPFLCPAIGMQPAFSPVVTQAYARNCQFYTHSPDRNLAAAVCDDEQNGERIETGTIDGELAPATLSGAPATSFGHARLAPEGDELWVRRSFTTGVVLSVYTRIDDRTWAFARDLGAVPAAADNRFSAPTRRVDGVRRFVQYEFSSSQLVEYSDDGTSTTIVNSYAMADLDTLYMVFPNITADGLRLVFGGEPTAGQPGTRTMFADRDALEMSFGAAVPLRTAPVVLDAFLTEDCGRLYTWGLGSIFYVRQQ